MITKKTTSKIDVTNEAGYQVTADIVKVGDTLISAIGAVYKDIPANGDTPAVTLLVATFETADRTVISYERDTDGDLYTVIANAINK